MENVLNANKVWQVIELGNVIVSENPETKEVWTQGQDSEEGMGYIVVTQRYVAFDGMKLQKFKRTWEQDEDGNWKTPEFELDDKGNKIPLSFSMTIPMEKKECKDLIAGQEYLPSFMNPSIVRILSRTPIKGFTPVINPTTGEATGMYQSKKMHLGLTIQQFNSLNDRMIEEKTTIVPVNVNEVLQTAGLAIDNPTED